MQSNRQLSREEWLRHVEYSKTSNLSISAYCRKHGLNRSTMDNWQRRSQIRSGVSSDVTGFVRAEIVADKKAIPDAKWVAEFLSHFLEAHS